MPKYLTKAGQTVIAGLNGSNEPEYLKVNTQFGALLTIDPCTQATVVGAHFFAYGSTSVNSGSNKQWIIVTADSEVWAHLKMDLYGSMITQFDMYEDTTWNATTDAALIYTLYNSNRNSTDTALTIISENPTTDATSADGTLLMTWKGGGAAQEAKTPTQVGNDYSIILKQDASYLVRITSGSASNLVNAAFHVFEVQYSS